MEIRTVPDDLRDVEDLIDIEFLQLCALKVECAPSLAEAQEILSAFSGSLADYISQDRGQR